MDCSMDLVRHSPFPGTVVLLSQGEYDLSP
jgi:hypothetical protein